MDALLERFQLDCVAAAVDVPSARFIDWAFERLGALLRFDKSGWAIGIHDPPAVHAMHLRGVPPAVMIGYEAGLIDIDFFRKAAAAQPGVTINSADIRDRFPDAYGRIRAAISIPFGIEQTLVTSLPQGRGSPLHHLLWIWRSGTGDPFSEAERALAQRCVPHMVAGWRAAQALDVARAAARSDIGQALADGRGELHSFNDSFVRLVRAACPGWKESRLPPPLRAALAGGPQPPGLMLSAEPQPPLIRLTLAHRPDLSLTPAQRRVARLYAQGLGHRAIAARLGIAPATVRNHVQAVFQALGVSNKVELARVLAIAN